MKILVKKSILTFLVGGGISASALAFDNISSISIPFSDQNAECGERSTVNVDLNGVLDRHTKKNHKIFTNREPGVEPANLPRYCQQYFFPLLIMAARNGDRLNANLSVYSTLDQCCKIIGGGVYTPIFDCWDVPAEMVVLSLPNKEILRSKVKYEECPMQQ